MKASSIAVVGGAALFVMPIPGTFVTGAAAMAAGAVGRWYGY